MSILVPARPKIYHIIHIDRLPSIIETGGLLPDAAVTSLPAAGTEIGMSHIKARRRREALKSYPDLCVGDCVPFYFCPRSVMLYVIHQKSNPDLSYRGGQEPIVHLEADLYETVEWAKRAGCRWAFTTSSAASHHFVDHSDLRHLDQIDWSAIYATYWSDVRDEKQAEFLVERFFPWGLISRIGCSSRATERLVSAAVMASDERPAVQVMRAWYY